MLVSNVSPCSVDTSPFSQRRDELNDEEFAYADDFDGVEADARRLDVVSSVLKLTFLFCFCSFGLPCCCGMIVALLGMEALYKLWSKCLGKTKKKPKGNENATNAKTTNSQKELMLSSGHRKHGWRSSDSSSYSSSASSTYSSESSDDAEWETDHQSKYSNVSSGKHSNVSYVHPHASHGYYPHLPQHLSDAFGLHPHQSQGSSFR